MITKQTSELTGPALDWAVAKCEGREFELPESFLSYWEDGAMGYSEEWAQGGLIIERDGIGLTKLCPGTWRAQFAGNWYNGPAPLIAAMRCYVASKLGESVDIPEELL